MSVKIERHVTKHATYFSEQAVFRGHAVEGHGVYLHDGSFELPCGHVLAVPDPLECPRPVLACCGLTLTFLSHQGNGFSNVSFSEAV